MIFFLLVHNDMHIHLCLIKISTFLSLWKIPCSFFQVGFGLPYIHKVYTTTRTPSSRHKILLLKSFTSLDALSM